MDKERINKIIKSAIVAFTIALFIPAIWVVIMGSTSHSPIIEKQQLENMTIDEHQKWNQENMKPVGFIEHIKGVPLFISEHWRGYIQSSIIVFIIVFILNSAYLIGGIRNEP